ncbi:hypothetical protein NliqN6_3143 [Naganishia liquefaciens]|uniref:Non-structural maintenance of chromosomes element 1 homolog n=1 Tax=Naganishia liquefaciens TaxID=104408 RepID=A0A8H3YGJ7_9TREE|nr:hypothetical protein NliqN6_3143 [Naganishia liquefaciens]
MVRFTDLHRVYLQALLSRRFISETVALELYKRAVKAVREIKGEAYEPPFSLSRKGLQSFVDEIGEGIAELGLALTVTRDETKEGRLWICVVNTDTASEPNDVTQMASDFSSLEITYYRRIISEIIEESYPANSVSSVQALNIAGDLEPTPIPKSQAQDILAALVSRGWLAKSARSRYRLGTRAMVELEPWLKSTFGEADEEEEEEGHLKGCIQCSRLLLQGLKCPGRDCSVHVHLFCYERLLSANRHQCKKCKISWRSSEPTPVGEDAIPRREDDYASTRRSKKRKTVDSGRNDQEDESEAEEREEEESEEEAEETVRATQRSRRH